MRPAAGHFNAQPRAKFRLPQHRLNVSRTDTPFTHLYAEAEEISIPVAHNEGNYFADDETLKRLQGENRIAFTYAEGDNPNGACLDIAGITDATGRVLGMMPHPERRAETPLGAKTDAAYLTARWRCLHERIAY